MKPLVFILAFVIVAGVVIASVGSAPPHPVGKSASATTFSEVVTAANVTGFKQRIALVEPTFTFAAYQNGSFYSFYQKYTRDTPAGVNITKDLYMLADRGIPTGPFGHYKNPDRMIIPHGVFHREVYEHIKIFAPDATVARFGDQHVHRGLIFNSTDGSNLFDVLVLFHNEYVTQAEYDNLRRFASNGGTILFTISNILYAEVSYDEGENAVTLVKGHDWEFDGIAARKSVSERWLEETREWVGSNFMKEPTWVDIRFRNNPFNYTHTEEQHVTNPNARLLLDYGAHSPANMAFNATVATYEMEYGKGKVVMVGLFSNTLVLEPSFWSFFDSIVLPHTILPSYTSHLHSVAAEKYTAYWKMRTGAIVGMGLDADSKSIDITLKRTGGSDDNFLVVLPKHLLSVAANSTELAANLAVTLHGTSVPYTKAEYGSAIALRIPVKSGANEISISLLEKDQSS